MAVSRGIRAAIANMTPEQRFWGHVEKTPSCWNWVGAGARSERGYGRFQPVLGCRKLVQAHRFAYETLRGLIPAGLELDHLCRNRFCVNPDHLEPVTPQTNQHRSNSVSGTNARKTVCSRGHAFAVACRIDPKSGKRYCRECCRLNMAACRARKAMREHVVGLLNAQSFAELAEGVEVTTHITIRKTA